MKSVKLKSLNKIFSGWVLCIFMCLFGCFKSVEIKAAEPKVMVTDYKVNPAKVVSGEDFTLTVTLKNTSAKKVKNLKLSILSEAGEFIPVKGAGTEYISEMAGEEELDIYFDMMAVSGLEEKSYKLTIKSEYEDVNGYSYVVSDSVYIPIALEQRISVTDIMSDSSVKLGDDIEISGRINNIGTGTLYNVTVTVEGENIEKQISYVGNIESGKSGNIDIITHTTHVTEMGAYNKNHITVTYEDKGKNKSEYSQQLTLDIAATNYSNLEVLKEPQKKSISTVAIITIIVCTAILIIIIFAALKWRKKKKILEEF